MCVEKTSAGAPSTSEDGTQITNFPRERKSELDSLLEGQKFLFKIENGQADLARVTLIRVEAVV